MFSPLLRVRFAFNWFPIWVSERAFRTSGAGSGEKRPWLEPGKVYFKVLNLEPLAREVQQYKRFSGHFSEPAAQGDLVVPQFPPLRKRIPGELATLANMVKYIHR